MCIYVTKIQSQLHLIYEYLLLYCNTCFIIRDVYLDYILYLNSDLFLIKKWIEKEVNFFYMNLRFQENRFWKFIVYQL